MICFYHKADLDGHCSGAIVKFVHPDCKMIGIDYGDKFPWDLFTKLPKEKVYLVDFSLPPSDMMALAMIANVTWIDHHKTAIDAVVDLIKWDKEIGANIVPMMHGLQKVGEAACELTWRWFYPDKPIPIGVKLLGRYDVWDHSDTRVLPYQYRMRMEDLDPANWAECGWYWRNIFNSLNDTMDMVSQGNLILRYEDQQNRKFCRFAAFDTEFTVLMQQGPDPSYYPESLKAIAVNRGFSNSKLFDSVYDQNKHELMISFVRLHGKEHKWKVSLYSTQDHIDCGAIAKSFGGGGHKGAAGFQCDELPFEV